RVDGGFEDGDVRMRALEGLDVRRELRPARESKDARDDELRVAQRALGAFAREPRLRERGDLLGLSLDLFPAGRPRADRIGLTRSARLHEVLRAFLVLFEVRSGRERERFLRIRVHTNLLSSRAWSPHGQAERRFVVSE